ncbi:pectinesterase inhibitor 9-like protein [Tanacetum coccineum]
MLISPSGVEFTYALRLNFTSTNNEAEYEALLAGIRMAKKMNVQDIDAKVDSKLVSSQINGSYVASCLLGAAYVCDIRTSYVSRQCTSSDGDNAAPCLPRGLAVLDWLPVATGSIGTCPYHLARILWASPAQHGPSLPPLRFSQVLGSCPELFSSGGGLPSRKEIFGLSRPEDAELKTLIATYDIPLSSRPLLPDSNFRMSILPAGDTAIASSSRFEQVMSIHDFLCMPSLEKATVREEPHKLGTSILGRVVDHATPPAPAGTIIPHASPEEIVITRPDPNVVAKADHAAKRKTSTGPEISTNTTKRTRLSQRVSGAGSSGLAVGDGVEQTDDGTLDDDDQRDGSESAMEDVENLNDVGQGEHINVIPLRTFDLSLGLDVTYPPILLPDKEVRAHAELSGAVRRTTRASSYASHGVGEDVSSPAQEAMTASGTNVGADEIASDGNVDSYLDARISNTAGDDDWDEIHGVNLSLRKKELYKDPKVCRTAIDHFPTPAEIHRLHELSSVELSDRMSVLQCQLITHGRAFHAHCNHPLREVERLAKRCAQQTQIIKKQSANLKQHKESTVRASKEVSGLKAELGALKSKCEATEHKLSSWDKKHRKYRSERDILAKEKAKIKEELKVAGFIPDAKEKFDRVIAAFPDTTFPFLDKVSQHSQSSLQDIARLEPDRVTPSSQPSSATASLRTNTYARHSTSSSRTFGHTSTPEHLKKKNKLVERGGPLAA